MQRFEAQKLQFIDCEPVAINYATHPIGRDYQSIVASETNVKYDVWPNVDHNVFYIWYMLECVAKSEKQAFAKATYVMRCLFEYDDITSILELPTEAKIGNIDSDALTAMLSISFSTIRGQLQMMQAKTPFRDLPLGAVSIEFIQRLDRFDAREYVPEFWNKGTENTSSKGGAQESSED